MKRLIWIIRHWRNVWEWAATCVRIDEAVPGEAEDYTFITSSVEFEVPGMVEPFDKMQLVGGRMTACGEARMGMNLHVFKDEWGGWNGGVIDHADARKIRDLINVHLAIINALPENERYRLQQSFGERRRLKREWSSEDVVMNDTITDV